jgi:quercetin dioxygenase-like cupin family protein
MATERTAPGEIVDIRAPAGRIDLEDSKTLIRIDHLQIFRMALPAGKEISCHKAAGVMIVQCLSGEVEFGALGKQQTLTPGAMLYLPDAEPHDLKALADTQLLITLMLHRK